MIVANQFIKTLPINKKEQILRKLNIFEKHLLEAENQIRKLPAGYYVRCIKNTDIFKFRLNNKDRILYTYKNNQNKDRSQVVFLQYVTHDEQVRRAQNIHMNSINEVSLDIDISRESYIDDNNDKIIDDYIIQYCKDGFVDMELIPSIVVSEEKLSQLADTNDEEYLYYLSKDQYDIISTLNGNVLITGAGGSGKTVVLHNVLAYAKENNQRILYVTYNDMLLEFTKRLYKKFVDENLENCNFYTVRHLEKLCYGECDNRLITYDEIIEWVKENKDKFKELRNRDIFETVVELNGILLGTIGDLELQCKENVNKKLRGDYVGTIELKDYLNIKKNHSSFTEEERQAIFKLGKAYIKWLNDNNLIDEHQVIEKILSDNKYIQTYDWVIVDEVQDLSEKQIYFLNKFIKKSGCIIWAGDINQVIMPTSFSYSSIKSMYFNKNENLSEFSMNKNYRSTTGIVDFINNIIDERIKIFGKTSYDYPQESIRTGDKPCILNLEQNDMHKLLQSISEKHYCALVVPNDDVKNNLIKKYSEIASRIFTIYEIKGLEYENIICYNIISEYNEFWKDMLDGNEKIRDVMRYYFNMIYIASSRAKSNLNIYEDSMENMVFKPYESCREINIYDEYKLGFTETSSSSDWEKEADRLERAGQGTKAELIRNLKLEKNIQDLNKRSDELFSKMYNNTSKIVEIKTPLDDAIKRGILLYRQRNYNAALKIFNDLLEKYSDESDLYYYIANCYGYMSMGRSYSYRYFWHAIKLNPYNYKCYLDMAAVLNSVGNYNEAIDILEVANKLMPQYGNAYQIMSNVYSNMGKVSKSIRCMEKSMKLPRFKFDQYNKMWVPPKNIVTNIDSENTTECIVEEKDNYRYLPEGVEFIKVETDKEIKECINNIPYKDVRYNKVNKRYTLVFDKEICYSCEDKEKCIFKKADKFDKISIKDVVVKRLSKLNKIKQTETKLESKKIDKEDISQNDVQMLIKKLNDKYGDNFDNFNNMELNNK